MQNFKNYINDNRDLFIDELFELLRIPSISSQNEHKEDMYRAAQKWKEVLIKAGVDKAEVLETQGHPVTYAEKFAGDNYPTVLIYGHMDVMPVDPIDLWETDPFEPVIKDGKIYGRGADDDKGQSFMHVKAFEYLVKSDLLNCNFKFLIEGEEEIGSPNLSDFCENNREKLKADVIVVSDTSMISADVPSITTGLRGLSYVEVEVTGPSHDLHSGLFGGAVANPLNVLSSMIAGMTDSKGKITVPGFYNDVKEVSSQERELMAQAPFDEEKYKKSINVDALSGEEGYSTIERTGIRPSFDVCGIWGGYTGEGAKTVLPSKAYAKLSCRLVPNQDNEKVTQLLSQYLETVAPASVTVKVTPLHGGQGYVCPIDIPAYKAAEKAFEKVYNKRPVPFRSGGSIPIIATFEEVLGLKSILLGFGLESDAIHSPNENYPLEQFFNGIETLGWFYRYFGE
ncbi:dipeptidase [Marinilabiliaceae bacterium ANBcel2]|nr:dipeptidase [Marinilabiliaceae bacterium ANBcel2]